MDEIKFIKSMQTMEIRENDIFIVKVNKILSPEWYERIKETVENNLPPVLKGRVKVFVLEAGMDVGIFRPK